MCPLCTPWRQVTVSHVGPDLPLKGALDALSGRLRGRVVTRAVDGGGGKS